jgi:hypothetical protein
MSSNMIPLSDLDLDQFEERELGERSNVAREIAEGIAMGGCAIEWSSSQLAQARKLVAEGTTDDEGNTIPAGQFFGKVVLTQLGNKTARTQKVRGGKEVEVERYKRELVAIRPA